jgi:hypothetical protein
MEEQPPKIKMTKVLYNATYMSFDISDKFIDKYKEVYGEVIPKKYERKDTDDWCEENLIRDKKIIHIYELLNHHISEKGGIDLYKYPTKIEGYVIINYDDEYGHSYMQYEFDRLYRDILMDIRHNKMDYLSEHKLKIDEIEYIEKNKGNKELWEFD